MVVARFPVTKAVDAAILGEPLVFPTSKLVVKNRFHKAALVEYTAKYDAQNLALTGLPGNNYTNLYEKWAAGGWGLVTSGSVYVDEKHYGPGFVLISEASDSPQRRQALTAAAAAIKAHGAVAVIQLGHMGKKTPDFINPKPSLPSALNEAQSEFTTEQITTEIVDRYAYAAKVAHETGWQGVEVQVAHGYLLSDFINPATNLRVDQYGGPVQNRSRVVVEVYDAIRRVVPNDFVIGIKISSADYQNDESKLPEAIEFVRILDQKGFDFINITGGFFEEVDQYQKRPSTIQREAFFFKFISAVRPTIQNAKVYITGGFRTVPNMVKAIEEKITDGICMGRPSTQFFDLPNQILQEGAQSAAHFPFPYEYGKAVPACALQMEQTARIPISKSKNLNEGIMNLTDPKIVKEFEEALEKWNVTQSESLKAGIPPVGVVPYEFA